jgi:hypothetical protein
MHRKGCSQYDAEYPPVREKYDNNLTPLQNKVAKMFADNLTAQEMEEWRDLFMPEANATYRHAEWLISQRH